MKHLENTQCILTLPNKRELAKKLGFFVVLLLRGVHVETVQQQQLDCQFIAAAEASNQDLSSR